ncbi:hypothetical protein [Hydrogenophaga sp. BPS33]|uniref:hypothetical protein n=1 Tax=Hydrogenophaga sp. BPS33 TaxID=2651974 RepID=UPI001320465A|nr:hypothetical protein [Hydrogenophaga sp. BPS33]QHE85869.1 hypothetical protein F9K07_13615 [Hydrogenophaga sp. BPS33]
MAQVNVTRPTHKPVSPDSVKDIGIPWKTIAAGSGRKGLSRVHGALKAGGSTLFYAVDDAEAGRAGMGRATSTPVAMARNKLAAELHKGAKANLDLVEKFLKQLCKENKRTCDGNEPHALHLYMGFDEVDVTDRAQAAGLLRQLKDAAGRLQEFSRSADCNQMLHWVAEAWEAHAKLLEAGLPQSDTTSARTDTVAHDDATGRKRGESQTMTTKESSATRAPKSPKAPELERSPLGLRNAQEILRRTSLRDQLLDALQQRDTSAIAEVLSQIPEGVTALEAYLPEPVANRHYQDLHQSVRAYAAMAQPSQSLTAFVDYCQYREKARLYVQQHMEEQPDTFLSYELRMRDICTELNDLHEVDVKSRFTTLALKMKFAQQQSRSMDEHLADQPFASIESILQKCAILLDHRDNPSVRAFRDAAKAALRVRTQAGPRMRVALLVNPVDVREVRKSAKKLFAHAMTTMPSYPLGDDVPRDQLVSMREKIQSLLLEWEADDSVNPLNIFVLRWIDQNLGNAL